MSYGYNNQRGYNSYGGGYARGNSYSRGGGSYSRQQRKKSGSKSGIGKNGKPYVTGWNASRQYGLVTFLCVPYSGTGVHESRRGVKWENWMCKVSPKYGKPYLTSCLYDGQKCIVSDLGIVINPRANNGGYCGRFGNKK